MSEQIGTITLFLKDRQENPDLLEMGIGDRHLIQALICAIYDDTSDIQVVHHHVRDGKDVNEIEVTGPVGKLVGLKFALENRVWENSQEFEQRVSEYLNKRILGDMRKALGSMDLVQDGKVVKRWR